MEKDKNKEKDKEKEKLKKSVEKAIKRNLPIDKVKWIYQPLSITMMRADLSPMQVNLMVEMVTKFQDKITEQLDKTKEQRQQTLSLFTEKELEQERYIARFPLSDLGVRPDSYAELEEAAKALQNMQIVMPVAKPDGTTSTDIFSLFTRISIPMLSGDYNYKSGKRRAGYIEMTMDKYAFNDVMRIGSQYTKYIKAVTRNCKCSYTSRIYMFISTYKVFGKWVVPYSEFHKILGFSDEKEIKKYDLFSDVRRRVLDPAAKELRKMSDEGNSDCYFEYEPIFPVGKKRGLPEKLVFSIYSSDLGKELTAENKRTVEMIQIEKMLKNELSQTPGNCSKLLAMVTEDNRSGFLEKMKQLKSYCSKPEHGVENLRSYAWQSLKDYLESHQPVVEEIKETHSSQERVGENVSSTPNTETERPETPVFTPDILAKWSAFKNLTRKRVGEQKFSIWFTEMKLYNFKDGELTIMVPTSYVQQQIEESFIGDVHEALKESFGDVALYYVIERY